MSTRLGAGEQCQQVHDVLLGLIRDLDVPVRQGALQLAVEILPQVRNLQYAPGRIKVLHAHSTREASGRRPAAVLAARGA